MKPSEHEPVPESEPEAMLPEEMELARRIAAVADPEMRRYVCARLLELLQELEREAAE